MEIQPIGIFLDPRLRPPYFKGNNVIDVHNQHRQGILALEKMEHARLLVPAVHHAHGYVHRRRHDDVQEILAATGGVEDDDIDIRSHTGQAALGQQIGWWDSVASNATLAVMAPPPPRMSSNSGVCRGHRPRQSAFRHMLRVRCAL